MRNEDTPPQPLERATGSDGRIYWRSMEQLARTDEFRDLVQREFRDGADAPPDEVSRRGFLGVVAAAVAMASTTACRKPVEKILPFADRPEDLVPGTPAYYATALAAGAFGAGVLVRSNDGRPTKVEGNALHPASLGGTDVYRQGDVLTVYDPGRSRSVWHEGAPSDWQAFEAEWRRLGRERGRGETLALLLPLTASPTLAHMAEQVRREYPEVEIHWWQPLHHDHEVQGGRLAFGRAVLPQYDLTAADRIVALDSDFLTLEPNSVRWAHDYAQRRKPYLRDGAERLNRLYAFEPEFTITGAQADHRFAVRAHRIVDVAKALAAAVGGLEGPLADAVRGAADALGDAELSRAVQVIAEDLRDHRGRSLVVAGPRQPAEVHALAHALNSALGNVGTTVVYTEAPPPLDQSQTESIRALAAAIDAGEVDTLLCLGTNPVYDAPADLEFGAKLQKVANTVHLGIYRDETARLCKWHLNAAHDLEAWGDIRAWDGTVSIVQPLIRPLYEGRSVIEVLALVADYDVRNGYDIVRYYWEDYGEAEDPEAWWRRALHDGLVRDSAYPPAETPEPRADAIAAALGRLPAAPAAGSASLELVFRQDATVFDGRWANNAWLQECPDPLTKLTWDNAALMDWRTAEALGVENGDVVRLEAGGRELEIAVWLVPGMAEWTVALPLGYGRRLDAPGVASRSRGFDTYSLRTSEHPGMVSGARATKTGRRYRLASTQDHGALEGRDLYRRATVETYVDEPDFAPRMSPLAVAAERQGTTEEKLLKPLWDEIEYDRGYQWGMVIDLNTCTGCSACVVACQSENNIPSVGKENVANGREMHWIRIDRYFTAESDGRPDRGEERRRMMAMGEVAEDGLPRVEQPGMVHQPVPCMHCETAPCESVCPVAATVHSPEGLNDMAYNRCIGTRYCSNNCPYKVRRFNWFAYDAPVEDSATLRMVQNPDVTVRSRGVMEKCTYCVQRINGAKFEAKRQGRRVIDGEFTTACAQACPTQAITFGNIADEDSEVAKLRAHPLNYAMLSERALKPRTTYLARVTNPNPKLL